MKKQKSSSKQIPIHLSANKKSHSINIKHEQQPLFVPYKIEWKNSATQSLVYGANSSHQNHFGTKQPFKSLQNCNVGMVNGNGSKAFYQNMKNQLLNIKQDVQKMILKQKRQKNVIPNSQLSNVTRSISDQQNTSNTVSSNGYVKSISIKNKCQQNKLSKVQSLYQNVQKALAGVSNQTSSKFTVGQSRYQQSTINNLIQDQLNSKLNLQQKYKSQNDYNYLRCKSKSIATVCWKQQQPSERSVNGPLSKKIIQRDQKNFQQNVQQVSKRKQKIQLDIRLPSFDKVIKQENRLDQEKQEIANQLKNQLSSLQKQLSSKDDQLDSNKKQLESNKKQIAQLKQQISNLQNKLNQEKLIHQTKLTQINTKNNQSHSQLKSQINQLKNFIKIKQQNIKNLQSTIQNQKSLIQNLNIKLHHLSEQLSHTKKQLAFQSKQSSNTPNIVQEKQLKLEQENKKLKQKYKLKQNQVYIYQEELKQAKHKIKELKEEIKKNNYLKEKEIEQIKSTFNESDKYSSNNQINMHTPPKSQSQQQLNKLQQQNIQLKSKNEQLNFELQKINKFLNQKQVRLNKLSSQNQQLKSKILTIQQQSKTVIEEMINNPALKNIGQELSKKFSQMVDENYGLKNKISHLQANIQELSLKNMSLVQEVKIYEEKLRNEKGNGRRLKIEDWDRLTQQRDQFKCDYQNAKQRLQQTKQFYEVEIMKKQNSIYQLKRQMQNILQQQGSQGQQTQINRMNIRQLYHPNIGFINKISNIQTLLIQFRNLLEQNMEMSKQLKLLRNSG